MSTGAYKVLFTSGYNWQELQLLSRLRLRRTSLRGFAAVGSWGSLLVFRRSRKIRQRRRVRVRFFALTKDLRFERSKVYPHFLSGPFFYQIKERRGTRLIRSKSQKHSQRRSIFVFVCFDGGKISKEFVLSLDSTGTETFS